MPFDIKKISKAIIDKLKSYKAFFKETYNKNIITMYIVDALIVTLLIEMISRHSVLSGIYYFISSPYIFLCNSMIVLMVLSVTLLMRKRIFGMVLISSVWLVLGIINGVLLTCRVTPFTVSDIFLLDSAFKIVNKYFSITRIVLVIFASILLIVALIYVWKKAPKVNHKINIPRNIGAIVLIIISGIVSVNLGIGSELLSKKFGNLSDAYDEYGFVYCFVNGVIYSGISRPDDYSDETMDTIKEEADSEGVSNEKTEVLDEDAPNIIFLQLESFFDVNHMTDLSYSENPLPNFTKLKETCPHGFLNVPVVGAGTVNTEFEILTGMNTDDFGPGEYPYKTVLADNTCESLCYNLGELGYKCQAIHNNTGTFYGRNIVFSNLGFDTFTSIENMNIKQYTSVGWAKDKYLTGYIMEALNSTKAKDFIYTISVQGHGSYLDDEADYPIKIEGLDDEDRMYSFEYYLEQINEMDSFIGKLIKKLENYDENVILVLYGDHLPSLGISEEELDNGDVYQTEYVIWSNYDIDYESEDIEAYEMEAKILEKLGITNGYINAYSQQNRNSDDEENYLSGLQNLEYDMLYGDMKVFDGVNPYIATDLQFGIKKVKLSSISPIYDDEGTIFVYGKNFTPFSKVLVNDEICETEYIDSSTLKIYKDDLSDGDVFNVSQMTEADEELNSTGMLVFETEDKSFGSSKPKAKNN